DTVSPSVRPDSAYLITGGLGGLGVAVGAWLAERGARHIVIASRRGLAAREGADGADTERRAAAVRAMEQRGATVSLVQVDIADPTGVTALFARFGRDLPPLRGAFHAATEIRTAPLSEITSRTLRDMFHAKVSGTWLLHKVSLSQPLDFFVLFSSTTALFGAQGLAHYAAANTFMNAVAHYRSGIGLPALSVD